MTDGVCVGTYGHNKPYFEGSYMVMKGLAIRGDHSVNVRATVPLNVWDVLVRVGREHSEVTSRRRITDERAGAAGLTLLLRQVAERFEDGDAQWLSTNFQKALKTLRDANFGTSAIDGATIDISRLHRNPKLKSGFEGVYANGQGFRAVSKDFAGKSIVIGTFKTSEEAAHRRLIYHRANNLAYGVLETEMQLWRSNPGYWGIDPQISDEQLIAQIKDHCNIAGTYSVIFGADSIEPTYNSKLPRRDQVLSRLPKRSQVQANDASDASDADKPSPRSASPAAATLGSPRFDPDDANDASDADKPSPTAVALGLPPGFDPNDIPPGW